jgi:alkanesulfonate monooxygenase SsuD/methylene tetrahydromethanopterin reductase-like flavin-dependent oxidoreductase (luciferase family)
MPVPVGLNVWSRLVEHTFRYLDQTADSFDSLWFPDHVQYNGHRVAEGWTLPAYALARYPDKLCSHEVLCNSFRNPAHLAKMVATAQALSGGRVILGIGAGWNEEEYRAYGWPFPTTKVRIAQLAEAIQIIRLMWREAPATFAATTTRSAGRTASLDPSLFRRSWWAAPVRSTSCESSPSMPTGGTTASVEMTPMPRNRRCSGSTAVRSGATTTRSSRSSGWGS